MPHEAMLSSAVRLTPGYHLSSPERLPGGLPGARLSASGGQSIDFHDFRSYQPGDDPRRVDWRAYARTGALHLKLFREEISPAAEILVDASASMGVYPGKAQSTVFLAAALAAAARNMGGRPVVCLGRRRHAGEGLEAGLAGIVFAGGGLGDLSGKYPAASRPWRFFISDFLIRDGAAETIGRLSAGAAAFTPIWLLSQSERSPSWTGGRRLVDAEDGREIADVMMTPEELARYRQRLRRHEEHLAAAAARYGGRLLAITVPDGELAESDLVAQINFLFDAGVLTAPRGGR